jgi:serine/threonine-protein kinase
MGLSHPNLCQIYEVGEQDGTWFIAMEWVNGVTLHQLIRRACDRRDHDYAIVAKVLAQCAEALHHAHTARDADGKPLCLVHRDVSPHNLMVAYDGRVKLLDFGIAKSTANTHHTEAGIVKGKVCYMAPEQWRNETLDARTDVFALGACLFEVLTGQMAFRRETQAEVMRAIVDEPVPRITDVVEGIPEALSDIVHRALAKDPEERFQSALEMSDALERFVTDQAEPVSSARIADYARRLFPSEVSLGPMLERAVRGAQLGHAPMLPPVPRVLREQETELDQSPSLERPLLPRLLGAAPLPAPPAIPAHAMPAPTEPVATPSRPPSRGPTPRGIEARPYFAPPDGTEVDTVLDYSSDSFQSLDSFTPFEPIDDLEQSSVRPTPASTRPRGPSAFSDAPTRPLRGISGEMEVARGVERQLTRTESMHVPLGARRRVAIALLATALGAAIGVLSYDSLRGRVPATSRAPAVVSQASAPTVDTPVPAAAAVTAQPESERQATLAATEMVEQSVPLAESPTATAEASPESPEAVLEAGDHAEAREQPARSKDVLLSINTKPWSTVYLGHRVLGTTPLANVAVPNKAIKLKLVDRDGHQHIRRIPRSSRHKRSVFFDFEKQRN